jgi:hypothetical protein
MQKRIVVVGAGPAGMIAAIRASALGENVTLIEKNSHPGKKLLLSGKGRCNLTNLCDLNSFLERFSKNGEFLRNAFQKFFNLDLMRFFETRGLKLKVERQQRVFPISNRSGSILKVLKDELLKNKVKVFYNAVLKDIFIQDGKAKGLLLSNAKTIAADKIILATGGVSYSFTGSTGEGIALVKKLGHHISPLKPGLVPLVVRQQYPKLLEGLTLKNIRLKFSDGEKQVVSSMGELLFTAKGISGPLVLSLSGKILDWLEKSKNLYVEIDLKPALSYQQLQARLLREFKLNPKMRLKNILKDLLPVRLIDIVMAIVKVPGDKKASQLSRTERQELVALLKGLRLNIISSQGIEEAMVTRGGVSLKEINPRTMESRIIKGLYFAGEMIDIDADTGGFNLQAAFSTGFLAGESAALN